MKQQNNMIEWKEVEFNNSEYFEVKKGKSITKDRVSDGNVPVVAGGQHPAYYHNKSNREGETITISGSGAYAGFVNYFKKPIFASDCSTVQTKTELISTKYAYLFLKSYQSRIYLLQKGIAQPHVYPKDVIKIKIPLPFSNEKPDLKEQERIVSILGKAETLKQKGKNAKDLLDEYLKSTFNEMFLIEEFTKERLRDNTSLISSGSTPLGGNKNYLDFGDILFIRSQNVLMNKFSNHDKLFISKEIHDKMKRTWVKKNDVLLNITGASIGRTAVYLGEDNQANVNQHVCIIRLNKELNPLYVNYYLSSNVIQGYIKKINSGGTREALNFKQIGNINISLPPLPLQQKFAKIVEQIEKMKENIKETNLNSKMLFDSLMHKAFMGEL